MELTVDKESFLQGLYFAQGIADRKATMPILANVLLRTSADKKVVIAATDLNLTIITEVTCEVHQEGELTVSAKHLHDLIKSLPSGPFHLRQGDNQYLEITAGKISYKIIALPGLDFPRLPDSHQVEFHLVEAAVLRDLIDKTIFSTSTDETRYHLNAALLECEGGEKSVARMVSTDGHRLSKCERYLPGGPILKPGILIPRKGLMEIRRTLEGIEENVGFGIFMGHLFLKVGAATLSIKLQDAQFPPYAQVIPKSYQRVAILQKDKFLESLKRIALMASDKTWGVKLFLSKEKMRVEADNPDLGQGQEELPVDYNGNEIQIGFNARYLIDLLGEMDTDEVRIELNGELDPGVVRPEHESERPGNHYLGVVMPMKM